MRRAPSRRRFSRGDADVLLLFATVSTTPLLWVALADTDFGVIGIYHVTAALLVGHAFTRHGQRLWNRYGRDVFMPTRVFWFATASMMIIWAAFEIYHRDRPIETLQQGVYGTIALMAAIIFYRGAFDGGRTASWLRWSLPTALLLTVGFMGYSLLLQGLNPIVLFWEGISATDTHFIQWQIFQRVFVGAPTAPTEVSTNLRHTVFNAVLMAMFISLWAHQLAPMRRGWPRVLLHTSVVAALVLITVSLSRAVILALLILPILIAYRAMARRGFGRRHGTVAIGAFAAVVAAGAAGFFDIVAQRFTDDTQSYIGRTDLYREAFAGIEAQPLVGGVTLSYASAHNWVVDSWLNGGIVLAAVSLMALFSLGWMSCRPLMRIAHQPMQWIIVAAAGLAVITRMLTVGLYLSLADWIASGLVAGMWAAQWHIAERPRVGHGLDRRASHGRRRATTQVTIGQ